MRCGLGVGRGSGSHGGARSSVVQRSGCRGAGLAARLTRMVDRFPGVTNHDNIHSPCQPITDTGALLVIHRIPGPVDKPVPLAPCPDNLLSLRAPTMTL